MSEPLLESNPNAPRELNGANCLNGQGVPQESTPATERRRNGLAQLPDVRREMARIYRDMRKGKIKPSDGTKFAYVLEKVGNLIESSDLLARLEALEAAAAKRVN